jgi:hypothetical protein
MNKGLQITLYVIAAWLLVLGLLFLLTPSIAEKVMSTALPDKALNMLYGQVVLTFAYVAFLAARGGDGLKKLSRLVLALTVGHVLVFGYQLITGMAGFAQAGLPLIINLIFTVLLLIFRRDLKS